MIIKTPQVMKVEKFLLEKKMPIKLVKLDETARSAEEASRALKTQVGSIIKSLLFQVSFENISLPVMALISGDKKGIEKISEVLLQHCKSGLAPYKYPRWFQYPTELPKTATGKIQRFRLRSN